MYRSGKAAFVGALVGAGLDAGAGEIVDFSFAKNIHS